MPPFLSDPLFIVFASITVTSVVSTIAYHWSKVRRAEIDANLKRVLSDRNMSADEIEKVLTATSSPKKDAEPSYDESHLKREMISRGMSADEIQKVLEATGKKSAAKRDEADRKELARQRD